MTLGLALAIGGAAISMVFAGIGSSIGVGLAGQAGSGITSEEPDKFGKVLLLEALPGTQGIYGFLGTFWVIMKTQMLSGGVQLDTNTGLLILFACLPVAIVGLFSGIYQGKVSAAGMNIVSKQPGEAGKAIILAVMVETYAVLGLLATILLINGIQV